MFEDFKYLYEQHKMIYHIILFNKLSSSKKNKEASVSKIEKVPNIWIWKEGYFVFNLKFYFTYQTVIIVWTKPISFANAFHYQIPLIFILY